MYHLYGIATCTSYIWSYSTSYHFHQDNCMIQAFLRDAVQAIVKNVVQAFVKNAILKNAVQVYLIKNHARRVDYSYTDS